MTQRVRTSRLLFLCGAFLLVSQFGCSYGRVQVKPPKEKSNKEQREAFYQEHRIASRVKHWSHHALLGNGTRIMYLPDLKGLISPQSRTGEAFERYERYRRYSYIVLGLGGGLVLASGAGMAISAAAPIPNNVREPMLLTSMSIGILSAVGFMGWLFASSILQAQEKEKILKHFNNDLREALRLPPKANTAPPDTPVLLDSMRPKQSTEPKQPSTSQR